MNSLKTLREQLDQLDSQISTLLNQRMCTVDQIGKIKREQHLTLTDKSREKEVLQHVEQVVEHPILKENIGNIYSAIIEKSKIAQRFSQSVSLPFKRIGVIGLGLMGGSICKAIKLKDPEAVICTLIHPSEDHTLAMQEKWIDLEFSRWEDVLKHAELIIIASPLSTIVPVAEEIKRHHILPERLIVIDIGSVKGDIVQAFENLTDEHLEYISTHPMAGKEQRGFIHSQATLFTSQPWVVVPHQKNSPSTLQQVHEFIQFLGGEPLCMDAMVHDQQAALVSHIPGILSKAFFDFVRTVDPNSMSISGPGFQSFTRLAHDNDDMRAEISEFNKEIIQSLLDQWLMFLIKKSRKLS